MGESDDGVVSALIDSLEHFNPQVRGNAAGGTGNASAGPQPVHERPSNGLLGTRTAKFAARRFRAQARSATRPR